MAGTVRPATRGSPRCVGCATTTGLLKSGWARLRWSNRGAVRNVSDIYLEELVYGLQNPKRAIVDRAEGVLVCIMLYKHIACIVQRR